MPHAAGADTPLLNAVLACGESQMHALAVSDTAAIGFLTFLDMMGVSTARALYESYAAETIKAWLLMTAHLPQPERKEALQRSTLADALPDMETGTN